VVAVKLEQWQLVRRYESLRVRNKGTLAELVASILRHGQQTPVVTVAASEPERYVLIDGYRRVDALRELARDEVSALVLEMGEADALIVGHRVERSRPRSALEDGWLLRELVERHGLTQEVLAVRLGRSPSWVSRRLSLVTVLPEAVQMAVRLGRVPAHAAEKSLVPLARANQGDCEKLVLGLGSAPVTVRELARLYLGYKRATKEQRARLIDQPRLYLLAQAASEGGEQPDPGAEGTARLRADLESIAALCLRARRRLLDGALAGDRRVSRSLRRARESFALLCEELNEEVRADAGSRHTNGHSGAGEEGLRDPQDRAGAEDRPQVGSQRAGQR